MEKPTEQRAAIPFCWKAGFNATKTYEMIQKVYGESPVHCAVVFHWYTAFSEGRGSIRDEQRNGRWDGQRQECVKTLLAQSIF